MKEYYYRPEQVPIFVAEYRETLRYEKLPILQVEISGDEWMLCHVGSSNRGSNDKDGTYGDGLINDKYDPHKVERFGLLGEMAIAKLYNWDVDFTKRQYDQQDFIVGEKTIDVKTGTSPNVNYVQVVTDKGRLVPIKHDIYICCHVISENPAQKTCIIGITGWQTKEYVKSLYNMESPLKEKKNTQHINKEITINGLNSILDKTGNLVNF